MPKMADLNSGAGPVRGDAPLAIRDRIRELRRVRARELLRNPKNWRRHPKTQADALRGLLTEIGYADALLARELPSGKLLLIDGHLRAETTPDLVVPVLVLDVTAEEADKLLLTLDPLAGLAQGDVERIKELLATVKTDSAAVSALLETIADQASCEMPELGALKDPEPQIDKAFELQKKWGTQSGQLWRVGPHRLLCADCRDPSELERLMVKGERFRMIWCDPPYAINYASKNEYLNRSDRGNRVQKPIVNDDLSPEQAQLLFETALKVSLRFAVAGAACYATVPSGSLLRYFIAGFEGSGFSFKHSLVWVKSHFVIGLADYHYRHEAILYGWLENGPHYFISDRTQDSVFEVDKPRVSDLHSVMKPVELVASMIANSSRRDEIVYDPFAGSGTTLLAAHQLRRIGYAVEIDPAYTAVSLERMSQLGLEPELVDTNVRVRQAVSRRLER
ncbi:MAG: DNA methyltransferase [Candidatus Binataceae bacterium]|jgi:DNA modification methylase